jgi:hypothetical protein
MKAMKLLAPTAALVCALPSVAATTNWNADAIGDYDDPLNWDNFNPSSIDIANIASGEATRSGNLNRAEQTNVTGTGKLIVNGRMINADGAPAAISVADTASIEQSGNYFIIGLNNTGSISQSGGTVSSQIDRGFFFSDGAGSQGTYNLTGGTLDVTYTAYGSDFHSYFLGRNGDDVFNVDGGDATFTSTNSDNRRIYISRNSVMNVDSGSATFNDIKYFIIGRYNTGNPTINVNGGAFNVDLLADNVSAFIVGGGSDGTGVLNINGGTVTVTDNEMWIGDGVQGIVNQTGGDVLVDGFNVVLGRSANINADEYNMSGGTLTAAGLVQGDDDTSVFNFYGGTIILDGDQTGLINEAWFNAINGAQANYDGLLTTITVGSALPGDADGDGDVDDADLGVAFSNYTGPLASGVGSKTQADGDTDGDGDVDDADLGNAFSAYTGPIAAAAVPEPTSLALLGLGGLLVARRRRA